jgi:biopolymer transport protein ExbD
MAGGMGGADLSGSGGGKRKPLDTQINLVPFIDLMAVTISFLIMTAVWTQIGRLQVSNSGGPSDGQDTENEKTVPLTLVIGDKDLRLTAGSSSFDPIPVVRDSKGHIDLTKLEMRIKEVRGQLPDQVAITLQTEDSVPYDDLVRIIDQCIGSGLPNVSVAAAMG